MVFSSTIFLFLFLPTVLAAYYIGKNRTYRNTVLLIASIGFYAWGEPVFAWVMLTAIAVNWLGVWFMDHMSGKKRKCMCGVLIGADIFLLFVYKYLSFVLENIRAVFGKPENSFELALPIGISFFTFQMMSYVFDVYYRKCEAQKSYWKTALYVSLFPQLIAGPIVRYERIAKEISERRETFGDVATGMKRFVYGLGKKVLIANYVAQVADNCFDYLGGNTSIAMAWLGAICYSLQIYYDFSGYSDMAIGLGRMFGFRIDENFNYPYISESVTEFWRRWHISLGSWFRDYVYIPLGGNRVKKSKWVLNLFIVWLLTGIWHGANWTFIVWGLLYFVVLLAEKMTGFDKKTGWFGHITTMVIVIVAWVIFRSDSICDAGIYLGNMFGIGATRMVDREFIDYMKSTIAVLLAAIVGVTPLVKKISNKIENSGFYFIESIGCMIIFVLSLLLVVSATYNPFIYFNF